MLKNILQQRTVNGWRALSMDGAAVSSRNWRHLPFPTRQLQIRQCRKRNSLIWSGCSTLSKCVGANSLATGKIFPGLRRLEAEVCRANAAGFSGNVEWDGGRAKLEGNLPLEWEIFKFMEASDKPNDFPTKDELIKAGRSDLVNAIIIEGGWLTAGWDSPVDDAPGDEMFDYQDLIHKADDSYRGNGELEKYPVGDFEPSNENSEDRTPNYIQMGDDVAESGLGGYPTARRMLDNSVDVSAGGMSESPVEIGDEESGIAGMLNRLERERTLSYGENSAGRKAKEFSQSDDEHIESWDRVTKIFGVRGIQSQSINDKGKADLRSVVLKANQDTLYSFGRDAAQTTVASSDLDFEGNVIKAKRWGIRSLQHMENLECESGGEQSDLEAICQRQRRIRHQTSSESTDIDENMNIVTDKINGIIDRGQEWMFDAKTVDSEHLPVVFSRDVQNTVMSRIQSLEFQLASTLGLLRSGVDAFSSKGHSGPLKELEEASNALEFRETEIMKTRAKLRSTRAKLAVLEGKMAIEIMEIRKVIEEKQRRLEDAQKVLSLLRAVRIVWSNSAVEVLLAGSFDGWTNKRRMTKSSAGVFVTSLHLYPGRYEIKFIVDGVWRVDPQRAIVYSNGFENNLLLIY